jgi:hypothetical protein
MKHKDAEKLACKLSKESPCECFYVNWIEDYEYCVDNEPEFEHQGYYNAGVYYSGTSIDDYDF